MSHLDDDDDDKQKQYDDIYKRRNSEDLNFVQIRIWVPRGEADEIKERYRKKRQQERDRVRRIAKHKAMHHGKRPSGRPSDAEVLLDVKDKLLTKIINDK